MTPLRAAVLFGLVAFVVAPDLALAHGAGSTPQNWWLAWSLDPWVAGASLLALGVYLRGWLVRRSRGLVGHGEAVLFVAGMLAIVAALQSPIDPLGERSFFMHQIQHLLLRSTGPLLIFVALPQATLAAGLSSTWRRRVASVTGAGPVRLPGALITHPVTVTALFIGTAYLWQWPPYFTAALRDDAVHYLMHASMLATGILFWWRVFDDRPSGTSYGNRIVMLWIATVTNIVLGAYLTLNPGVLYPVYDELGRVWVSGPADEILGGIVVWIPGSNMALVALLVVLRRWGNREQSLLNRSTAATAVAAADGNAFNPAAVAVRGTAHQPAYAREGRRQAARVAMGLGLLSMLTFALFLALIVINLSTSAN